MCLDSVRLQQCKERLEKCEMERCNNPKVIISAIEDLFDLVAHSANDTIKWKHPTASLILSSTALTLPKTIKRLS